MNGKIAVTTTSFAEYDKQPLDILRQAGFEVKMNEAGRKLEKNELIALCHNCTGIIAGTESYDAAVLENLPGLRMISRCGVGMDSINSEKARELGIKLANTASPAEAVAELTIGLILDLLRNISFSDHKIREGAWKKYMGYMLAGRKAGVLGFGSIGQKVADLLHKLGASIAYFDIQQKKCCKDFIYKPLPELLAWADILTVHCSADNNGKAIIGETELELLKKGAYLINASRGGIVDEDALYTSLKQGHLAGAALDVFQKEPYSGKLKELNNVVLTPHIGSYAKEARIKMEIEATNNIINGLK
jgi:D-3-phosphoglycerate dehydrogenase / 2-oxoglutarate reductase